MPGDYDSQPAIQDDLDAAGESGGGTVTLRPHKIYRLNAPLVVPGQTTLDGRGSTLIPRFIGTTIHCRGPHPDGLTLADSVVPGPGRSLVLGVGKHVPLLQPDYKARLNDLTSMTVEGFFDRTEPTSGPLVQSCLFYNNVMFRAFGLWLYGESEFGPGQGNKAYVYWDDNSYHSDPNTVPDTGLIYWRLTFDGTTVKLYLGAAPGEIPEILSFASETPTVPTIPNSVSVFCVGMDMIGPAGGDYTGMRLTGKLDSVRVSYNVRSEGPFIAPTEKHFSDQTTLLLLNFEQQGIFTVGRSGDVNLGSSLDGFFVPEGDGPQSFAHGVKGIRIDGSFGGSGIHFHDTPSSFIEDVVMIPTHAGLAFTGSCFDSHIRGGVTVSANSYALIVHDQCMDLKIDRINLIYYGVGLYVDGAVGGAWAQMFFQPRIGAFADALIRFTADINVYYLQVDDEGNGSTRTYSFLIDDAVVNIFGGQIIVGGSIPPFTLAQPKARLLVQGVGLFLSETVEEVIHFETPPDVQSVVIAPHFGFSSPPLSLTPAHVAAFPGCPSGG